MQPKSKGQNEVFILQEIVNPEMKHNIMNKYVNKAGEEAIFHNNKESFTDGSGKEWKMASKIIRVSGSDIPTAGIKAEPPLVVKAPVAPLVATPKEPIIVKPK